jgi:hypothetical protein
MRINIDAAPSSETYLEYKIEDVQSFAGQTVTVSFWAKSTIPYNRFRMHQQFGSGGSATISIANIPHTLSNNWQKYSFTVDVPSLSGKTVGPGSSLSFRPISVGAVTGVIDIAQVQLNIGDKPLPFAPRPYAEELALCQRYCEEGVFVFGIPAVSKDTTNCYAGFAFMTRKRTEPTVTIYSLEGTAGLASWETQGISGENVATSAYYPSTTSCGLATSSTTEARNWVKFIYLADAEL